MKKLKTLYTITFVAVLPHIGICQNLVQNPSFEQYLSCPDNENQVEYATDWKNFLGTPEYYNSCSPNSDFSTPNNLRGFQIPYLGSSYTGFFAYWSPYLMLQENVREQISQKLAISLIAGTQYYVSIKVALAIGVNGGCASSHLGVKFTNSNYENYATDSITSPLINDSAHLYTSSIVSDTLNWTIISGSFIADSAYQYMVIGNFFRNQMVDTLIISTSPDSFPCYAYYYLDDVCVSTNPLSCGISGLKSEKFGEIEIYPNPFNDQTTIFIPSQVKMKSIELLDIHGKKVKTDILLTNSNDDSQKVIIQRGILSNGVYQLKLITDDNKIYVHKLIIN